MLLRSCRQTPRSHRHACNLLSSVLVIAVAGSSYVSANTERLVALETFEHLQSLSLGFHLQRETGSVLRSVSRGASSFAGLLRIVLFQILPVFVQVGCKQSGTAWLLQLGHSFSPDSVALLPILHFLHR